MQIIIKGIKLLAICFFAYLDITFLHTFITTLNSSANGGHTIFNILFHMFITAFLLGITTAIYVIIKRFAKQIHLKKQPIISTLADTLDPEVDEFQNELNLQKVVYVLPQEDVTSQQIDPSTNAPTIEQIREIVQYNLDSFPENTQLHEKNRIKTSPVMGYIEDGSMKFKTDSSEIADEEVAYLIQLGLSNVPRALETPQKLTAPTIQDKYLQLLNYNISSSQELSSNEEIFIKAFISKLEAKKLDWQRIRFHRLSDKTFNVLYGSGYVGKIRLHGKNTYMQVLQCTSQTLHYQYNDINEYISSSDKWCSYIYNHLRNF